MMRTWQGIRIKILLHASVFLTMCNAGRALTRKPERIRHHAMAAAGCRNNDRWQPLHTICKLQDLAHELDFRVCFWQAGEVGAVTEKMIADTVTLVTTIVAMTIAAQDLVQLLLAAFSCIQLPCLPYWLP